MNIEEHYNYIKLQMTRNVSNPNFKRRIRFNSHSNCLIQNRQATNNSCKFPNKLNFSSDLDNNSCNSSNGVVSLVKKNSQNSESNFQLPPIGISVTSLKFYQSNIIRLVILSNWGNKNQVTLRHFELHDQQKLIIPITGASFTDKSLPEIDHRCLFDSSINRYWCVNYPFPISLDIYFPREFVIGGFSISNLKSSDSGVKEFELYYLEKLIFRNVLPQVSGLIIKLSKKSNHKNNFKDDSPQDQDPFIIDSE